MSEAGPPSVAEESFGGSCPQCDTPYRPGGRFCQKCGATLPTEPLKELFMTPVASPGNNEKEPQMAQIFTDSTISVNL